MGKKKSKSSRKGKKEWRANISTEDIEDFFDNSTKDALSGGSLAQLPSDSLFYVDKSTDLSVKRKIEKKREKVLRYESMLQRNAFVEAVPSSTVKKSKKKSKEGQIAKDTTAQPGKKDLAGGDSGMVDIWDDKGELVIKTKKKPKTTVIPAVEVEPPGCSFNPPSESHQDALACAVADEMQKIYRNELGPEPIPLVVPGEAVNEEDMYFLEADSGSDVENENLLEDGNTDLEKRSRKPKMLTQVDKNRRARRKEKLKAETEATKAKQLSKEIDSLPDIIQEIEKEEEEKQKRHLRRVTAKKEKLKSCPPCLGKRKFEPTPAQVLLSEEITGSLRKLKGCCTLARDRFKSLEKRGLVVPSKKSSRK
ncbi:ribosome biogenesis protein NOP53 [Lycium barbarum]|uniref:ribosome biogenesis protein NOP53 n=1 Tax=Lycium barbarum TaxID=112863 RepID=UPI00293E0D1C|nr:ribosome biogenesis protein NOP53 [Lycium barbarum]